MDVTVEPDEVQRWVELLRSGAEQDKLKAAAELGRIGVRTRGAVMTRGTLTSPAQARMSQEHLQAALQALSDANAHPQVREEVAFVLGEWADDVAVTALKQLVIGERKDAEWRVRAAAVDALAKIGGPDAVEALREVALTDVHEDVRARAVGGLAALAKATAAVQPQVPVRTRGAVRTRGVSPLRAVSREAAQILDLLKQIRAEDSSDLVHTMADGALAELGE